MTPRLRLTVLGSGTLLPNRRHHSAAYLVEACGVRCLVDCGAGTVHGFHRHQVEWETLDAVVFSHYHTDHLGDLPALLFALKHGVRPPRERPLTLVGPPGLRHRVDALADAFGEYMEDPGFPLHVEEVDRRGGWHFGSRVPTREPTAGREGHDGRAGHEGETGADLGRDPDAAELRVDFHPTPHTDRSVAHRWQAAGRVVAYTGDTGSPGPDLADFLSDADVLVTEASLPDSTEVENHLTPSRVAALAREAEPALLITTHVYPPLVPEEVPELVSEAGYGGRTVAGLDGLVVELGGRDDPLSLRHPAPDG